MNERHSWARRIASILFVLSSCIPALAAPQDDLWRAAEKGNRALVLRALQAGVPIDARDGDGWTALMFASSSGAGEVVKLLLSRGANPNVVTADGQTPLIGAVVAGDLNIVKALVQAHADVLIALPNGKTAMTLAQERKRLDIAGMLAAALSAERRPAAAAAKAENGVPPEMIRTYLAYQAQLDERREALRQREDALRWRKAELDAQKQQVAQAARERYERCQTGVTECEEECRKAGTRESMSALFRALPAAKAGKSDMDSMNAISASGDNERACVRSCAANANCDSLLSR